MSGEVATIVTLFGLGAIALTWLFGTELASRARARRRERDAKS
jgi:hypothetical protein